MRLRNVYREKKYDYIFIWLLIGCVFSFSLCLMILSGSKTITKFYDVGQVYEIKDTVYKTVNVQEKGHQESSGRVVLDQGHYVYGIGIEKNKNKYNYFCIQIKDSSIDDIEWIIDFRKQKGEKIIKSDKASYSLHDGMNVIDVPKNSFNTIAIGLYGENGSSVCIEKMQLRETKPVFDGNKALKIMFVSFLIYLFISCIFIFCWRKLGIHFNIYIWIEALQKIYISISKQIRKFACRIPMISRCKNGLIVFLFLLMFLYSVWVEMHQSYFVNFKYHAAVYSVIIFLITILSIESKNEKKSWNNSLVVSWLILWLMACVSDFLIPKNFRFIGFVMIFIVGFFIFVCNNMEKPDEMIRNFVYAIHIFLILTSIFCVICRPETGEISGIRYSGISKNPSIFALYLATIYAVILGEIEHFIKKGDGMKKLIFYILEGCVTLAFAWKSQSMCPLLCIAGISFIWFVRMSYYTRKQKCRKRLASIIISSVVLMIPAYSFIDWSVKHIPQALGTVVTYEGEEPVAKRQYGMVVYASDLKEEFNKTRLGQKLYRTSLSGILSGRDYYYRTYLREMNLFGHKENPEMWGKKRKPHNAVLGIAHRYGIFASIPYILMLVMVIVRTFRYSNKLVSYAAVPFYVCLSSIVMSMADNVEQPFVWLPWIGLYLMMGIAFDDEYGMKQSQEEKSIS